MESPFRPDLTPDFRVIETFGWDGVQHLRLARHEARARETCAQLGIPFFGLDPPRPGHPARIRVAIAPDGTSEATVTPLMPAPDRWRVAVAAERLEAADPWLRIKTTRRGLYDRARAGMAPGVDELIFLNERDEVCEGTITNLFFDRGQGLRTPPLASGLLPGVLRAELLDQGCKTEVLPAGDLAKVRLWMGNSLRGLIPAQLILS
ncbi:aminotransferase class IV [Plastorhodobacter daqingensis]|uniref:Probable branched-chain-amino-acid aminotransferase n=1 Tax=Plastorhodobacter daqingensis TaxID=1387281 RepID=A0ABW2ULL5_9RHOB